MLNAKLMFRALAMTAIAALWAPVADGQSVVDVVCVDQKGRCEEILRPDPIRTQRGDRVVWNLLPSCADRPCSGVCRITVPPQEGFEGFQTQVQAPGRSKPTPPFEVEGVYPYRLECSPILIGTIIVGNPDKLLLSATGNCPGTMTLNVSGATPNNRVYFIWSLSSGSAPVPGCPNLMLDLNNPRISGSDIADAAGDASISGYVAPAGCGRVLTQAVDLPACKKTNTYLVP